MGKQSFIFLQQTKKNDWPKIVMDLRKEFHEWQDGDKDFQVTIELHKKSKTWQQLKGLYRLLEKICPVLREQTGMYFDVEKVKTIIKDEYGYYHEYKGVKLYKSLKDASVNDMMAIIKTTEVFGQSLGIDDCYIKSYEIDQLKEFYNIK